MLPAGVNPPIAGSYSSAPDTEFGAGELGVAGSGSSCDQDLTVHQERGRVELAIRYHAARTTERTGGRIVQFGAGH